jgi:hypothetical protein
MDVVTSGSQTPSGRERYNNTREDTTNSLIEMACRDGG